MAELNRQQRNKVVVRFATCCSLFLPFQPFPSIALDTGAHICPFEARARAAETLGKDLAYFFSGDYLSACDLSAALARLIPDVVRGDVKPKTAHTAAYLAKLFCARRLLDRPEPIQI